LESSQKVWDSEAIEKDRQTERKGQISVEPEAECGWKNQYHKEKIKDTLKAITLLRVNKLYRRCASTV